MTPAKKLLLLRGGCLILTAAAIFFALHHVSLKALLATLRSMQPGWFAAAVLLYGLMFLPAAWRWHLALSVNRSTIDFATTTRFSIIGHFFYLILLGAAGGDTAKAALYARHGRLSFAGILASVSLDRLIGFGGLVLFAPLVFAIGAAHGGLVRFKSASLRGIWWVAAVVLLAALLLALVRRSRRENFLSRFGRIFLDNGRKILTSPKIILPGLLCAFAMQAALSAVLALNLRAVCGPAVPWLQLAWTFPLIIIISGLPITVAGIGTRDGAALALLGLFGIGGAYAEAMALLTLITSLFWSVVGAGILWRELKAHEEEKELARKVLAEGVN